MHFDLILVGYTLAHTRQALGFCHQAFPPSPAARRLLVLNHRDLAASLGPNETSGWEIVAGSNVLGEFSGWQEGLDALVGRSNGVIFMNDTITVHRKFTAARRFALTQAVRRASGASFIGFRDRAPGRLAVAGLPLDSWVRSYCFALTPEALALLERRIHDPVIADACVPGGLDEASFFAGLSPDLTARLRHNLFGGGWYASAPLDAGNAARMAFKGRCIVSEKWLSARCQALGVTGVDPFVRQPLSRGVDKLLARGPRGVADGIAWVAARSVPAGLLRAR